MKSKCVRNCTIRSYASHILVPQLIHGLIICSCVHLLRKRVTLGLTLCFALVEVEKDFSVILYRGMSCEFRILRKMMPLPTCKYVSVKSKHQLMVDLHYQDAIEPSTDSSASLKTDRLTNTPVRYEVRTILCSLEVLQRPHQASTWDQSRFDN